LRNRVSGDIWFDRKALKKKPGFCAIASSLRNRVSGDIGFERKVSKKKPGFFGLWVERDREHLILANMSVGAKHSGR
jgi:hypothetical protein